MSVSVSIIVPVYNEEGRILKLLDCLECLGADEILVVDGGSQDRTVELARSRVGVVRSEKGRALQMNEGARHAVSGVLWFVHADVHLRPGAVERIRETMSDPAVVGGNFEIRFDGEDWAARFFDFVNRERYRFGIFYGDSGIFCRREVFERLGGYHPWPILEDYEFARRLWKAGPVRFLPEPIFVSDRRWRNGGMFRTLWSWFWIMSLYLAGVSPYRLARMYRDVR